MNRACLVSMLAAAALSGCGSPPPAAKAPKVDPTTEGWDSESTQRLANLDRAAEQYFKAGHFPEVDSIITGAQSLETRLLAAPRPTLEAMEAVADLDRIYGKRLVLNGYFGEARLLFQKNVTRWKTWKPQTPETDRRLREANTDIAECDKHMGG